MGIGDAQNQTIAAPEFRIAPHQVSVANSALVQFDVPCDVAQPLLGANADTEADADVPGDGLLVTGQAADDSTSQAFCITKTEVASTDHPHLVNSTNYQSNQWRIENDDEPEKKTQKGNLMNIRMLKVAPCK